MSRIRRPALRWPARLGMFFCLFLLSPSIFAGQLLIQPGDIVCSISAETPVTIAPNGDVTVTITDADTCLPQAGPPAAPMLSLDVLSADEPGEVRLTWTSSDSASSCEASSSPALADWNGSVPLGENRTRNISGLAAGNYTFNLSCANSSGSSPLAEASGTILSTAPAECSNRPPPAGWTRLTSGCKFVVGSGFQGDCRSWTSLFGGEFLDVVGGTQRLATNRLNPNHYLAIQFNSGNLSPTAEGSITSDRAGGMMELHFRMFSISTCPGDFDQAAVSAETGCYGQLSSSRHIFWGGTSSARACKLEPNTTYYLNIIGTNSPLGTDPDLLEPNCPNNENCGAVYDPQPGS